MDFIFDFTILANTTEANAKRQEVDVGEGVIHRVEVGFPRGCAGLANGRVRQALTPRWPSNEGAWYHWDGYVYVIREHHRVKKGDAPLTLMGFSEDDTFPHTLTFRFSVLPVWVMEPWGAMQGILDTLLKLLGVRPKGSKK